MDAQRLGMTGLVDLLEGTLGEEWEADRRLTRLAEAGIDLLATVRLGHTRASRRGRAGAGVWREVTVTEHQCVQF